jgi:hypothetical protein
MSSGDYLNDHNKGFSQGLSGVGGIATSAAQAAGQAAGQAAQVRDVNPLAFLLVPLVIAAMIACIVTIPSTLIAFIPLWAATKFIPGMHSHNVGHALIGAFAAFGLSVTWIVLCAMFLPMVLGEKDIGQEAILQFTGDEYMRWSNSIDGDITPSEKLQQATLIMFGGAALLFGGAMLAFMSNAHAPAMLRFTTPVIVGLAVGIASLYAAGQLIRTVAPMTPIAKFVPDFGRKAETLRFGRAVSGEITGNDQVVQLMGGMSYDDYWLILDEPAAVRIDASSEDFAAVVVLENWTTDLMLNSSVDGATLTAVSEVLPAGRYMVNVLAPPIAPNRGGYRLTVTASP